MFPSPIHLFIYLYILFPSSSSLLSPPLGKGKKEEIRRKGNVEGGLLATVCRESSVLAVYFFFE